MFPSAEINQVYEVNLSFAQFSQTYLFNIYFFNLNFNNIYKYKFTHNYGKTVRMKLCI